MIAIRSVSDIEVAVDEDDGQIFIRQEDYVDRADVILFYAEHVDALIAALLKVKAQALEWEANNHA